MAPLVELAIAAAAWFLLHAAIAGTGLRAVLAARTGERGFRALFALLSIASLVWLVRAYGAAPCAPLWTAPRALFYLPIAVVPLALVLLAGAFMTSNPGAVGAERALARADVARGVLRITRHPFLWAVALWATVHLAVTGTLAAVLFFGSLLLTALVGTRDIDRKRSRQHPEAWARYTAVTSNLPFAAVLSGRNRIVLRELLAPVLAGLALTVLVLLFHARLFRVAPLP
ncbi:MAG TPA: NnrU family protein [Polyangiaceae bacterium]|nr:NnrU family protein [Polyangiaceae bacterium]